MQKKGAAQQCIVLNKDSCKIMLYNHARSHMHIRDKCAQPGSMCCQPRIDMHSKKQCAQQSVHSKEGGASQDVHSKDMKHCSLTISGRGLEHLSVSSMLWLMTNQSTENSLIESLYCGCSGLVQHFQIYCAIWFLFHITAFLEFVQAFSFQRQLLQNIILLGTE